MTVTLLHARIKISLMRRTQNNLHSFFFWPKSRCLVSQVQYHDSALDRTVGLHNKPKLYSLEPLTVLVDCFLAKLPSEFATEFASTVKELFGGLSVAEGLKLVCKNNNDDGTMLLQTWVDELDEERKPRARLAVWDCIEANADIVTSSK
ncbi:uncharacterized protein LOC111274013 [Varroa jacobsoni]|uniref:uncharacterized protein LOC111274013 n=1 Tax=Varroa jacobsoni TaxID=62625 RepID=UPI000BF8D699|nr:uncharacterized protein LOC111274013 [Varroa jacobsoni]